MTNLKPSQIIIIGAAIVFGVPIIVGLVVGHFFGFWAGFASGAGLLLFVAYLGHRELMRRAREQEKKNTKEEP
jgi:membrane protein implicated in regulation of membrane protease activity